MTQASCCGELIVQDTAIRGLNERSWRFTQRVAAGAVLTRKTGDEKKELNASSDREEERNDGGPRSPRNQLLALN